MPATLTKTFRHTRRRAVLNETTPAGLSVNSHIHQPQAGSGACRLCSCKKYVPENRFQLQQGKGQESMHAYPCGNCGHDVRQHA